MKLPFQSRKGLEPTDPVAMRLELYGQKLPAEKIGEIAAMAASRIETDEAIPPEVAAFTAEYLTVFRSRVSSEQARLGPHALIAVGAVMFTAGLDLRQAYGDPSAGDFIHDSTGLQDGANATQARFAAEQAMGKAYYDMVHPR